MSDKAASEIKITQEDISAYLGKATDLLTSITYQPTKELADARAARAPAEAIKGLSMSSVISAPKQKSMAILKIAGSLAEGDKLMDESVNAALNTVRTGFM